MQNKFHYIICVFCFYANIQNLVRHNGLRKNKVILVIYLGLEIFLYKFLVNLVFVVNR